MQDDVAGEREMEVATVTVVNSNIAQVLLREKVGGRLCALHCEMNSGIGIDQALTGYIPRQMHVQELVRRVMQESRTRLTAILLMSGTENYVWGRLFLNQEGREFTIDCRAADAVAQAQRWKLPIMIDELLLRDADRVAKGFKETFGPVAGNA